MYIPKNSEVTEKDDIIGIINAFGFGLVVSPTLEATSLPLLYKSSCKGQEYLYGHFAKANPQWRKLINQRVLVVFSGPHSYISPSWYCVNPAVPTWNYVAVHCYGKVELLTSAETAEALDELVSKYEPELLENEQVLSPDLKEKLSKAIVGFRIAIDDIQAKEKLGQHRSIADQAGVYQSLCDSGSFESQMLAQYMNKRGIGSGKT